MKTVTSVLGGQTSAYIAANYDSDELLFSLVRIESQEAKFPDKKIRQEVEDRIQSDFIATAEDDTIIYTMLDLEQLTGKKINWVTGPTFDWVIKNRGGWLPNKLHRYCTTALKIEPMFHWWYKNFTDPVQMNIGFRASEMSRAKRMTEKLNRNGLLEIKASVVKHPNGNNKWEYFEWQKPSFPLIRNKIYRDQIVEYWKGKPVRFAELNNCVGCFHRNPLLLKKQFEKHPKKMNWFASQEGGKNGQWRTDVSYNEIKKHRSQIEIDFEDFGDCDSGFCGT